MLSHKVPRCMPLYPFLGLLGACNAITIVPFCNSSIYCNGELLQRVQLSRMFNDSKTFVDRKLIYTPNEVLANFSKLMHDTKSNPTYAQLVKFVDSNFEEGKELQPWLPPDFNPEPPFLQHLTDPELRDFAKFIIGIWAKLGRRVDPDVIKNADHYSFISLPNGFIVPGGRFKEVYYWDSFWVVRGLLISNMTQTAKGMIENLLYLVNKLGYVPNGSRIYYLGRSQPPLLAAMMSSYYAATGDILWLQQHITTVEKELEFWLTKKKINVKINDQNYFLLRYYADRTLRGPRPESFYEDFKNAQLLPDEGVREDFYAEIKSAAESGWDFSSRWFVAGHYITGNLTDVHATRIIPVDLNAIFAGALEIVGNLRYELKDKRMARKWWSLAKYWRSAIQNVLWHESDGVWYDYDAVARAPRKHFYTSCITPLWAGAVNVDEAARYGSRVVRYLLSSGALDFPGGVPASIMRSGEQWDYPNAWPPLQSILIGGLEASGHEEARKLARELARIWINANYIGYKNSNRMFEKYSAVNPGQSGGGGEYDVQDGFGWTNGVALELIQKYSAEMNFFEKAGSTLPYVRQI